MFTAPIQPRSPALLAVTVVLALVVGALAPTPPDAASIALAVGGGLIVGAVALLARRAAPLR